MKYRTFGRLDWRPSALGFGVLRLPVLDGDRSRIDETPAIEMIRYAIDHGVNILDSGYSYHGGNSERLIGKALRDGYRERVRLSTKMPTWLITSQDDMDKYLDEQLEKLRTDHIDFYLLHGLRRERWNNLIENDVFGWAEKTKEEGKIGHLGFSFHDEYSVFKEIIDSYNDWALCMIQYNYVNPDYQAGVKGLRYAASRGLAVVVMEPIHGGRLAIPPSQQIQAIWDQAPVKRTPAEWALQWVWNQPEVSAVLSGMSTIQQVAENIESADRSGPGTLTSFELQLIERVRQKYREMGFIGCTACMYCTLCPQGVAIPEIFTIFNQYYAKGRDERIKEKYREQIAVENRAGLCNACGRCEELCPQQLPIRNLLRLAARTFESTG